MKKNNDDDKVLFIYYRVNNDRDRLLIRNSSRIVHEIYREYERDHRAMLD